MGCHANPLCTWNQSPVYNCLINFSSSIDAKDEELRSLQYVASLQDLELTAYFRLFKETRSNFSPKLMSRVRLLYRTVKIKTSRTW